jgi:hypothetical protein
MKRPLSHEEFLKWINHEKDYSTLCHNCEKVLEDWGDELPTIRFCSQYCYSEWYKTLLGNEVLENQRYKEFK